MKEQKDNAALINYLSDAASVVETDTEVSPFIFGHVGIGKSTFLNYLRIPPMETLELIIINLYQTTPALGLFLNVHNDLKLEGQSIEALHQALSERVECGSVRVRGRPNPEELDNLVVALRSYPSIRHLSLIALKLDQRAINPIVKLIETNRSLKTLDLRYNEFGIDVLKFVQALENNRTITRMYLPEIIGRKDLKDLEKTVDTYCRCNQSYHLARPACVFFARIRKDPGVASTFALLSRDVLFKIFSYCSDIYTRDNLLRLYTSLIDEDRNQSKGIKNA